jgi:transcriptional regulator with XRE-family HTH domain
LNVIKHNDDEPKKVEKQDESIIITTSDLEQENRRAKVLALHSKGLTQLEIAERLGVDQSTVSRDLHHIRQESRKYIETHITKNIPFEFNRYLAGLDQITKKLWEMAEKDKGGDQTATTITISNKDIMAALTLLIQCYNTRLEMLVGGPESNMNAKKHIIDIKQKEKIQHDPFLKSMMDPYSLEE